MAFSKDTFCSYCGNRFAEQNSYPRKCFYCSHDTYHNPIPVVIAMVPVWLQSPGPFTQGWLIGKRNIPPQKGGWAFISGYMEVGETWQQAISRELQEEVDLMTKPEDFQLVEVVNATNNNLLIFGAHLGVSEGSIGFQPNHEVSEIAFPADLLHQKLCFPIQNQVWERYLKLVKE